MASEMEGVDNLRILIAGVADNTDIYASADDIRDALDNIDHLTTRIAELDARIAALEAELTEERRISHELNESGGIWVRNCSNADKRIAELLDENAALAADEWELHEVRRAQ